MPKRYFLFLFLLFPFSSQAQIVNTERLRVNSESEGWAGTTAVSFSLTQNTKQLIRLKLLGGVEYLKNKNKILLLSNFTLSKADQAELVNKGFAHLRYNFKIKPKLTYELFSQIQFNGIQKLERRWLSGTGLRFSPANNDSFYFHLGASYMSENELLTAANASPTQDHRMSSYISLGFTPNKILSLSHVSYFQPLLDNISDFRISSESRAQFKVSKKLSFHLTFSLAYDSKPPVDLPKLFYNLTQGLSVRF